MVNTREIAGELRLSHWAGIMQERTRTGMSIKAFCQQMGICQNTYFYWQRKVRAAADEKTGGIEFPSLSIEIGGCRVRVPEGVNPELLSTVCKVLVGLC